MYRFLSRRLSIVSEMQRVNKQQDYAGAIEALNSLQSNAQYIKYAKIKNNQENNLQEMVKFLSRSGVSLDRLDRLPVIHVAGTNGKGTTCAYCESILRKHGYKTGFYSSPHLLDVRERIRINGVPISKEAFTKNFWAVYNLLEKQKSSPYDMPLYFRFMTILAFHIFISNEVDVAVLEVGIGGEYDCTNVVRKTVVAGITPLDIDHTSLLGNSIESIAWNKGGIFKPNAIAFTAPQKESAMKVLEDRSIKRNCKLEVIEDYYQNIEDRRIPAHVQKTNASLALSITKTFIEKMSKTEFCLNLAKEAIESTYWPGRYEVLHRDNFTIYLDGAHTVESIKVCSKWFKENTASNSGKDALIFNLTGDRSAETLMKVLMELDFQAVFFVPNVGSQNDNADNTDYISTTNEQIKRCKENKKKWLELLKVSQRKTEIVECLPSVLKVFQYLDEKEKYNILITGSIHLIGAAMNVLDPNLRGTLCT